MKKCLVICQLVLFYFLPSWSQVHIVIMGGISPESNPSSANLIVNRLTPRNEFVFNMIHVKPQYFGSIKAHVPLSASFFTEAGLTFTQKSSSFTMAYTMRGIHEFDQQTMTEKEDILMIPATIGVKLGIIDVTSGLTGVVSLSKKTELNHLAGFTSNPQRVSLGWSAGARINLFKAAFGIEYQGNLNRVGQGMSVNGQSLELMNVPGQFVATIQFKI